MKLITKPNNEFKNTLLHNTEIPLHRIYSKTEEDNQKKNNDPSNDVEYIIENFDCVLTMRTSNDLRYFSVINDRNIIKSFFYTNAKALDKLHNIINYKNSDQLVIIQKNNSDLNINYFLDNLKPQLYDYFLSHEDLNSRGELYDHEDLWNNPPISIKANTINNLFSTFLIRDKISNHHNKYICLYPKKIRYKYLNKLSPLDGSRIETVSNPLFFNIDKINDTLDEPVLETLVRILPCNLFKFNNQQLKDVIISFELKDIKFHKNPYSDNCNILFLETPTFTNYTNFRKNLGDKINLVSYISFHKLYLFYNFKFKEWKCIGFKSTSLPVRFRYSISCYNIDNTNYICNYNIFNDELTDDGYLSNNAFKGTPSDFDYMCDKLIYGFTSNDGLEKYKENCCEQDPIYKKIDANVFRNIKELIKYYWINY